MRRMDGWMDGWMGVDDDDDDDDDDEGGCCRMRCAGEWVSEYGSE